MGPVSFTISTIVQIRLEFLSCTRLNPNIMIATKFALSKDSGAVVASTELYGDLIAKKWTDIEFELWMYNVLVTIRK